MIREAYADDLFTRISGIISLNSRVTSHLGVLCRSLGIGGVTCALSEQERASAKFALFQDGRLKLYRDVPDFSAIMFASLMADINHRTRTGD